jgi:outer membrane assembly lipoprotein YfgL
LQLCCAVFLVAACSSSPEKPKPAELGPSPALMGVRLAWTAKVGAVAFPVELRAWDQRVAVAGTDGTVVVLDTETGQDVWRVQVGEPLSAGVGSDGTTAAVVTQANTLVAMADGRVLWRQKLTAQTYTEPLVAGARVFVLTADRSVLAFDAKTGRKLWTQQRPGEALVLRQPGVILAVGDTLVLGWAGRMVGLNPSNGSVRWDVPLAVARGTNDIERLVDIVGGASREGGVVCMRAFQSRVGCVDAVRGTLLWSQAAQGASGLSGNPYAVFGIEADGRIQAWNRDNGSKAWSVDTLRYRELTAPASAGRAVVVGDQAGLVHVLSAEDGSPLNRLTTDGSPIAATPVLVGETLVVLTRQGGVFGFQPQ